MPPIELPYITDEKLSGLAIAYRPSGFIAEKILPRVKVDSPTFKCRFYPKGLFMEKVNTEIGEYGESAKTEFKYEEKSLSTSIYSHTTMLSLRHLKAPTSEANKEANRVQYSKDILLLADEIRVAELLRNEANYSGNVLKYTKSNNFSNSDTLVISTIEDCMNKMFKRPNVVAMSSKTMSKLRTCPQVVSSAKGTGEVKDGKVSLDYIKKDVFGIDNILISDAKFNSNKRGQDVNLQDVWGNDIIFAYLDENADVDNGVTFGQCAVYKDYSTTTYIRPDMGAEGVKFYKTGDEHVQFIASPDCGYIIKNAFNFD